LSPEYEAIETLLHHATTHPNYRAHHVKGHQKGANLSWEAQLNNVCDELATEARALPLPRVAHRLPGAKATLFIQSKEVTSSITTSLRHAATTPDLREYFCKKYKWKVSTIESIDWIITSRALKRIYGRAKAAIQKFLHEWLPFNGHPAQSNTDSATLCPCCKTTTETHKHFLECNHPELRNAWSNATQVIQTALNDRQSDPILKKLIICAIVEWRNTPQPELPDFLPSHYHELFHSQSRIGWDHFLQGRWTTHWVKHHDEHAKLNKVKTNGETWASTSLRQIWENLYEVWKQRCNLQHGNQQHSRREATIRRLEPRVRAIYGLKDRLDHQDREVLSRPIQDILALHPTTLEKWVFRTEQFVRKGVARAKKREKYEIRSITQFFTPTGNATHLSHATLTAVSPPAPPQSPGLPNLRQATIALFQNQLSAQPAIPRQPSPPPPPKRRSKRRQSLQQRIIQTNHSIKSFFAPRPLPPTSSTTPTNQPATDGKTSHTDKANLRPP
jgi:hypothetical protein